MRRWGRAIRPQSDKSPGEAHGKAVSRSHWRRQLSCLCRASQEPVLYSRGRGSKWEVKNLSLWPKLQWRGLRGEEEGRREKGTGLRGHHHLHSFGRRARGGTLFRLGTPPALYSPWVSPVHRQKPIISPIYAVRGRRIPSRRYSTSPLPPPRHTNTHTLYLPHSLCWCPRALSSSSIPSCSLPFLP